MLAYVDAKNVVRRVAVTPQSELDRLRLLSERIAAFGLWHPARVATYVLTRTSLVLARIYAEVRARFPEARSRIILTIDPTCTPREVAAAYRAQRREHFHRLKRLSVKHARLAAFAASHARWPTAKLMAVWNRATPSAAYRHPATFTRDCVQATERLLYLGLRRHR